MAKRYSLIQARQQANLTQAEVAELVGISRTFYSQIETGARRLEVELAKRIADLLDLDLNGLLLSDQKRRDARSGNDEQAATKEVG